MYTIEFFLARWNTFNWTFHKRIVQRNSNINNSEHVAQLTEHNTEHIFKAVLNINDIYINVMLFILDNLDLYIRL